MYEIICKYFFIFLSSFYLYKKGLNLNNTVYTRVMLSPIFALGLSYSDYILMKNLSDTYITISMLIYCIFIVIFFQTNVRLSFIASCITYILSHIIFGIISGLTALCTFTSIPKLSNFILVLITGIFSFLICHIPFQIKRFKSGMKFLYNYKFQRAGFCISLFSLSIMTFAQYSYYKDSLNHLYLILSFIFLTFIIIYWWQRNITKSYLDKLRKLELESLRQELEEKDAMIQKLMENNDAQARLIHKDNKLIPAMVSAVTEYLESADSSVSLTMKKRGDELSEYLQKQAGDRIGIIRTAVQTDNPLPLTNHAGVDAMLSYMQKRANMEQITFNVKIHPDFPSKIGDVISEADLSHLLSDLIDNAIIATRDAEHKHILVHLGILYDAPAVEVSDSGLPFDPAVYQDFGLQRHSTHLDNGGSGIGLMDIWELKKKYAASIHIYEYAPGTNEYTKILTILFDRRKHYLIRSHRPEELVQIQTRSDLYILPL